MDSPLPFLDVRVSREGTDEWVIPSKAFIRQKSIPKHDLGCFPIAAFRERLHNQSPLFAENTGRHESIRKRGARVYETDKLHGWIVRVNSLGYGNHPLF
jgi:hypothetical protein